MQEEYGSSRPVRFPNKEDCLVCDVDGNPMLCKCGKPAEGITMGRDAFLAFCKDCIPGHKLSTRK